MSNKGNKIKYASVIVLSVLLAVFTILLIVVAKAEWSAKLGGKSNGAYQFIVAFKEIVNTIFSDFLKIADTIKAITVLVGSDSMTYTACAIASLYLILYVSWIFVVLAIGIKALANRNWFIGPIMLVVFVSMLAWFVFQFFGATFKMTKPSDTKFISGTIPFVQFFTHVGVISVSIVGIIIESLNLKKKSNKNVWESTNTVNADNQ
ncbi:hypothetical protein NPA07_02255 [Mycoplasmopsis caviae]|uniref:Uncharacterized protein n=1 Tax=Mycoplasmopsis caviae TaxID=55603 RepID=A0A3P8LAB2_9BACT|nr:hypothetical protein [Mycoplasmopsis caviae]UUD35673.1 hypothetical protein NPA07_02255 [Mycoplasmopsis caviae]VDR41581.1 Uncharacterised protein [Mycoplasmopsis caviae]